MGLSADLDVIAAAAAELASPGEEVAGVIPTEPEPGRRIYLVAFEGPPRTWSALDADGAPLADRETVRAAIAIAALCELAEESAGGGRLAELRRQLASLRSTEHPDGIEDAEDSALELERVIGSPPRVASPEHLEAVGAAARRLELALGQGAGSPFAEAMKHASAAVGELELAVESGYKGPLT